MILRLYIALHDLGGDHHGQIRNLILEFLVRLDALLLDNALGLLDHSGCLLRGLAQDLIAALCGTAGSGADDLGRLLLRLRETLGVFRALLFRLGLCLLGGGVNGLYLLLTLSEHFADRLEQELLDDRKRDERIAHRHENLPPADSPFRFNAQRCTVPVLSAPIRTG